MIRLAEPSDGRAIADIYGPMVTDTAVTFETVAPTADDMAARIRATLERTPWLVLDRGGVLGYAYASPHHARAAYRWSVDASVYVHAHHRGAGVARMLYEALFALLRLQGFHAVHAGITLPNAASVRLHEGFGFRPVGVYPAVGFKLGAWHDVGWWQLALSERTGEPDEPRSPAALRESEAWRSVLEGAG